MEFYRIFNSGSITGLGCGYRTVIGKEEGRTKIRVLDFTTLESVKLERSEFRRMSPEVVPYKWGKVKRIIREGLRYKARTKFIREVLNHKA